jgi:hypothetical protein
MNFGGAVVGERLGGFIYGTILVLAVLVGGAKAYPDNAGKIAVLVAVTTVVFWLAHVYAHAVARVVAEGRHVSFAELREIARHEASIIEAAIPPIVPLIVGATGLISTRAAVWIAYGLGLGVLVVQGFVFARVERLGWFGTASVITANLALGLALVALKLFVSH